jgi:hypothetical protein
MPVAIKTEPSRNAPPCQGRHRQRGPNPKRPHPNGLSRGEILNLIGVKGDKSGEQSVSNALSALTKQNQLGRKDKKYVPA